MIVSKGALARSLIIILLLCEMPAYSDGLQSRNSCFGIIPNSLEKMVKEFGGWRIVSLEILDPYDRKLFVKDHKGKCPGIAKVDLYGDGRKVYAIVLTRGKDVDRKSKLILAEETGKNRWQITTLEDEVTGPTPVAVQGSAGEYEHVYREKKLTSQHEVVFFIGYESWAIVYAWNGKEIEKIQASD